MSPIFSVPLKGKDPYLYRLEHYNRSSLLTITLLGHRNWYQSFLSADGLNRNGLQLEKIGQLIQVPTVNFGETAKN